MRSLSDGKIKLVILATKPADPKAPKMAELTAGIDAGNQIVASDFKLGPTKSDTVDEKSISQSGKPKVFTDSNYEASLTSFRDYDATGKPTATATGVVGDGVYQALKTKGSTVYVVKRFTSKNASEPFAVGDPVQVYELLMDNPADAEASGYIKAHHPCEIQNAWIDAAVAT